MDANGLRFWQLADAAAWPGLSHAGFAPPPDGACACGSLRLASERTLVAPAGAPDPFATAQAALDVVPRAVDALECVASWDAAASCVRVHGPLPDDVMLLPLAEAPTDLALDAAGVLLVAQPSGVRLHDLRGRWDDVSVTLPGFVPWRIAARPEGGAWVLERAGGRVAWLHGLPLRRETPTREMYDGQTFRPLPENGNPPRLELVLTPQLSGSERIVAITAVAGGLWLLGWRDGEGTAALRRWTAGAPTTEAPLQLVGANYAYAMTPLDGECLALRVPSRRDAPAFDLASADDARRVLPLGDIYPLAADAREAGFGGSVRAPGEVPHYPVGDFASAPLLRLSYNSLARQGEARSWAFDGELLRAPLLDSGDTTTVWHRLFAEAAIPPHAGFVVWLATSNEPRPPALDDAAAWHPHAFGEDIAGIDVEAAAPQVPHAAWERAASEQPGHPGLLGGTRVPGRRGLFGVLVQASRQRMRRLVGRFLWLRVVLHGDGRSGPEIAALRVSASRFDYAERYLPRLFRETEYGAVAAAPGQALAQIEIVFAAALDAGGEPAPALRARLEVAGVTPGAAAQVFVEEPGRHWRLADTGGAWRLRRERVVQGGTEVDVVAVYRPRATPADFNARLLANFEGVLTTLEDRVAAAHLFSDPQAAPEAQLDWLGAWVGVAFDAALPATRRREWLRAAPDLARRHGTRDGLRLALDIATGGAVRRGEVLVVEDFRLRRILATLLGVQLSDANDPLLPGLHISGNSVVGDTLVLGGHEGAELAALFTDDDPAIDDADDAAALAFLGRLAHRATVLVHQQVQAQDFALIRRIVELEAPAHVQVRVANASWPLLLGVSSLVGVDTFLGPPRLPQPVHVQRSVLGLGDRLLGAALLDPRLAGNPAVLASPPPVADAGADFTAAGGASFLLDGSASTAAPPRRITEYRWQLLPPADT